MELGLRSALRHVEDRSAIRCSLLVSLPTTCQHYSFESMENLSEHRDRANKTDNNELRTTLPFMCVCVKYASAENSPVIRESLAIIR